LFQVPLVGGKEGDFLPSLLFCLVHDVMILISIQIYSSILLDFTWTLCTLYSPLLAAMYLVFCFNSGKCTKALSTSNSPSSSLRSSLHCKFH
jgi:hypothetical protein